MYGSPNVSFPRCRFHVVASSLSLPRCRFHVVAVLQGDYVSILNKDFDCISIVLQYASPSCHFHVVASTLSLPRCRFHVVASTLSLSGFFNLVSIFNMAETFYLQILVIFSCLFSFGRCVIPGFPCSNMAGI